MKHIYIYITVFTLIFSQEFDSPKGAAIRQGVHIEWYRTVCKGDNGSGIFVWSDTRYGMRNIFAHKILENGDLQWGTEGTIITNLPGRQEDPVAIEDNNGGAFIAWVDYRFDEQGDIFIQHVDELGNLLMDANGVALALQPGKQISINMSTDSLGGVFVTWQDKRGGVDDDIYGTHVSSNNQIISPGSGVPIVSLGGTQAAKSLEYAGNNEALLVWSDSRSGENIDIYGQRFSKEMSMQFEVNGIPIANSSELETKPRTTYINNNKSIVVWKSGDENARILYQIINQNGLVLDEPKRVSSNEDLQTSPRLKRNDDGDIFIQWTDLRSNPVDGDIYIQKIDNSSLDISWSDDVKVDESEETNFGARFSGDSNGGLNIVWERGVFPDIDILFKHFDSDGNPSSDQSIIVSDQSGYQFSPITIQGSNGVFVVFADQETGSIDLKVQHYESTNASYSSNGLVVLEGLDGDIRYSRGYNIGSQKIFFMWEDNRSTKKIFGSTLDINVLDQNSGTKITFSDNSSTETDLSQPKVLKVESGAFIATFDASVSPKTIRINKINNNYQNEWGETGVLLSPDFDQRNVKLAGNGDGIVCFWSESRGFNYDVYIQSFDQNGNKLFTDGGINIINSNGDDYIESIVNTPDGNYLVFWLEEVWPASRLKYKKIMTDGSNAIGWSPNGYTLSSETVESNNLKIEKISDEKGILAAWNQAGNFSDIYTQLIKFDGSQSWGTGGVPVTTNDNDQISIDIAIDTEKQSAFIVWQDYKNGSDFNIIGKTIALGSGDMFISNELDFTDDTTDQQNPVVYSVSSGEYLVMWEDGRGYNNEDPLLINGVDLYGSGFVVGGGPTTPINGIPICIEYHDQKNVQLTSYSDNQYFCHWVDLRSSGKADLANYYGKIISKADILSTSNSRVKIPNKFSIERAYPNPFNGSVKFEINVPSNALVEFMIFDLSGKTIYNEMILPSSGGKYGVSWNGITLNGKSVSSGIYYYYFSVNSEISTGKITYLK